MFVAEEVELHRHKTVWVRGTTNSKIGVAVLTNQRILFWDEKYSKTGTGGILDDLMVEVLQKRHSAKGPLLDIPVESITGIKREKKLMAKKRIRLTTTDGEHLFNEGWDDWSPILIDVLTNQHGRQAVQEGDDTWRFAPA